MDNTLLCLAILIPTIVVYVPIVRGLIAEYRRLFPASRARSQRAAGAVIRGGARISPIAPAVDAGSTGRHRAPSASRRVMSPAGTWRVSVPAGGPVTRHGGSIWVA